MNLRTKKGIAREILYFFSSIILILIFWGYLEIQNFNYQKKADSHEKAIDKLQVQMKEFVKKPLLQPDKLKQLNKNAKIMSESGSSEEEILAMKVDFLERFGNKYTFSEQSKLDKLKKNEQLEIDKLNRINSKILNREDIFDNIKLFSILIFTLLYPIRITLILVSWAIKILKVKN